MAGIKFSPREFYNRHPFISHLVFVFIAGMLVLWGALLFLDSWTFHGHTAIVPQIKGRSFNDARTALEVNNLTIEISDSIYDRDLPPGTVVESWPKAGAVVKDGRQVYVTVTAFSPKQVTISMPLSGNVSSRQAMSYLRGIGISDIRLEQVPSEYADLVMGAKYEGKNISTGSVIPVTATVTLQVGSGPVEPVDSVEYEEAELVLENAPDL